MENNLPTSDPHLAETHEELPAPELNNAAGGSAQSANKRWFRKKWVIIALVVAVLIMLAGASTAAYVGIIVPNKPENIVKRALANTLGGTLSSAAYEGRVDLSGNDIPKDFDGLNFNGTGDKRGTFSLDATFTVKKQPIVINLRALGGTTYVKESGVAGLLAANPSYGLNMYGDITKQLDNQWYSLDKSTADTLGNSLGGSELTKVKQLSQSDIQRLGQVYKQHPFIKVVSKQTDQAIYGLPSWHFTVMLDKTQLKAFVAAVKDANIKALPITDSGMKQFNEQADKIDFAKYPIEMWIDKSTKVIDQLLVNISEEGTTAKVRVSLKNINKPANVEAPASSKPLTDLVNSLLSDTMINNR